MSPEWTTTHLSNWMTGSDGKINSALDIRLVTHHNNFEISCSCPLE